MIVLLVFLILISWVYWIIAATLVWQFFRQPPVPEPQDLPPVSILKPVKGLDTGAYENFASFCRQDYPEYEILFGVADPLDAVIPIIERLQDDFPGVHIRLLIIKPDAPNRKISLLTHLAKAAHYQVLAASDSDMRVKPQYLRRVVAELGEPGVGLVTCPYRGSDPVTLTARLEALYMGVTFLPSMIIGRKLMHMGFALGASNVMRKQDLKGIGGFEAVGDYLADDHQLGKRMAKSGKRVVLSNYIVDNILGTTTFLDQWEREVRWAHCNRASRPTEYPGLLISYSTPLAALLVLVAGIHPWSLALLAGSLAVRWLTSLWITYWTDDRVGRRWLFWLPVRDFLTALIWCAGIFGRTIKWRGEAYFLQEDGRMTPLENGRLPAFWSLARVKLAAARLLDVSLYRKR